MPMSALLPGEERTRDIMRNGMQYVEYVCCTERGKLFRCVSKSLEAAQEECEQWLLCMDRHLA